MIAAGVLIVREVLLHLGLDRISPSERDLLNGVALAAAALPDSAEGEAPPGAYHLLLTANICARNFLLLRYLRNQDLWRRNTKMSTTEQTADRDPDGHLAGRHRPLQRRLRGPLRGRDLRRRGHRLRGHARRRQAGRLGAHREPPDQGREPPGAPALPRVLRRRAPPRGRRLLRRRSSATATTVEIDGEITIKGITQPATLTGTIVGPAVDHFGANRVGLKLETTVDRTKFDIELEHAAPERRAGALQRGHPQGRPDPGRPGGVDDARPRDQRLAPDAIRNNDGASSARCARRRRRASRSTLWDGLKEIPPYDQDDDARPRRRRSRRSASRPRRPTRC